MRKCWVRAVCFRGHLGREGVGFMVCWTGDDLWKLLGGGGGGKQLFFFCRESLPFWLRTNMLFTFLAFSTQCFPELLPIRWAGRGSASNTGLVTVGTDHETCDLSAMWPHGATVVGAVTSQQAGYKFTYWSGSFYCLGTLVFSQQSKTCMFKSIWDWDGFQSLRGVSSNPIVASNL